MHAAKSQLSQLVHRAARGETILIAKAGQPLARLVPLEAASGSRRLGFLAGQAQVPDDFDQIGTEDIADLFAGE